MQKIINYNSVKLIPENDAEIFGMMALWGTKCNIEAEFKKLVQKTHGCKFRIVIDQDAPGYIRGSVIP